MNARQAVKIFIYLALAYATPSQANASADGAVSKGTVLKEVMPAEVSAQSSEAQVQGSILNQCVRYTYDKNGNRLEQENTPIGGGGIWGSSRYLCFIWGS